MEEKIPELEERARELFRTRPVGFGEGFYSALDIHHLQEHGSGVVIEYASWSILEALRTAYTEPENEPQMSLDEAIKAFNGLALDLAELRRLKHTVPQGIQVLAEDLEDDSLIDAWGFAPPVPLWRWDKEWTRWTAISFGRGPNLNETEPEFSQKILNEPDEATILTKAKAYGFNVLPLDNQVELQQFNRFAPSITQVLRGMPPEEVENLSAVADCLKYNAQDATKRTVEEDEAGAARIKKPRLYEALSEHEPEETLSRLVADGSSELVAPLLIESGDEYLYSPELAKSFARVLLLFRPLQPGTQSSDLAADTFESMVSHLLKDLGCTVRADGHQLVGVTRGSTKQDEIDVLAWNDETVFLVEAKAMVDHPGAWSAEGVQKRRRKLAYFQEKLAEKEEAWVTELEKEQPQARVGDAVLDLRPRLGRPREAQSVVVSIRAEPETARDIPPVRTYMPQFAAEVARRRLPIKDLCPIWDGSSLPP